MWLHAFAHHKVSCGQRRAVEFEVGIGAACLCPPYGRTCDHENRAPFSTLAPLAHSPAPTFGPSACTRVTLKRPSAHTTVMLSASTAAISPSLPAMPFGLVAGIGLASKIFNVFPSRVVPAAGVG